MADDETYMARALELAARGRGRTSPNPLVGCVVVRNGEIVSEGFHEYAGGPHAEVVALDSLADAAESTIYVTLEPCCHDGRTSPCVEVLKERNPKRLVVAMEDPNPLVSGAGLECLRAAGIEVEVGVLEEQARQLNEIFIKFITTKTPFVIAKCGMSLDGKIATRTGDSRWVTGEDARQKVHELRNEVDAIMVGSRTVMLDDPSLTTRLPGNKTKDPIRIILDAGDYLDSERNVFHLDSDAPTWVAVPDDRNVEGADEVLRVPDREGNVDMGQLMRELGSRDITSVLIEGGGATHASAFEADVVDKVMFFVAPKIIGGRDAVSAVEGEGVEQMSDVVKLEHMTATAIGDDILIQAYVARG